MKACLIRRKLRAKKKATLIEKISYMAGGFGLSTEPETLINEPEKRKKKQGIKRTLTTEVDFVKSIDINFISDHDSNISWIKMYPCNTQNCSKFI